MKEELKEELLQWSRHFRENFDKLLALVLYMTLFFGAIHVAHHNQDQDLIGWVKEGATGAAGAFFILLTGRGGKPAPPTEAPRPEPRPEGV